MSYIDKHIVEAYSEMLEGLSYLNKLELIESRSKSLKTESKKKEKDFHKSFAAFSSEKSVDDIISDLKSSRKFRDKNLEL